MFKIYSTAWCGDCVRIKNFLLEFGMTNGDGYEEIDIDQNPEAADYVMEVNGGNKSVPTIVFEDGTSLTEPSVIELEDKLEELNLIKN